MVFSILSSPQGAPSGAAAGADGLIAQHPLFPEMAHDILCPHG